jgi:cystathionine beta-lyase/cystathionine gamma-synthase
MMHFRSVIMNVDRPFSSRPAASPIYPATVYALADLDALERISSGSEEGYIYARDRHPNGEMLAREIARLENAQWGVVTASGMGAIVASVLALVKSGDRVLASDQLYGRTTQFLGQELGRLGIETIWCDACSLPVVDELLTQRPRLLVVETISNPLLRVADIPKLAEMCRRSDCILLVDNTFATPTLVRPLDLGAHLVIESLTKMIGGHSDGTLGIVVGNDQSLNREIAAQATIWGMPGSPFDCWLTQRSLPTLSLRVHQAGNNAKGLADWLIDQKGVNKVIYPSRSDHPDCELARRLFSGPPGNVITFEIDGGRDAVNRFMRTCPTIPFCPSLGDVATTCSYPAGTSHRYLDAATRQRLGITDGMIRLSVGIEPMEQIQERLAPGLN